MYRTVLGNRQRLKRLLNIQTRREYYLMTNTYALRARNRPIFFSCSHYLERNVYFAKLAIFLDEITKLFTKKLVFFAHLFHCLRESFRNEIRVSNNHQKVRRVRQFLLMICDFQFHLTSNKVMFFKQFILEKIAELLRFSPVQ